jgi:hypothetical protein
VNLSPDEVSISIDPASVFDGSGYERRDDGDTVLRMNSISVVFPDSLLPVIKVRPSGISVIDQSRYFPNDDMRTERIITAAPP